MPQEIVLVTVPPQHCRALSGRSVTPAHLAYRIGPDGRLLRAGGNPRGGRMVLSDCGFSGMPDPAPLLREILSECRVREFSGVILDFDRRLPPLEQLAVRLESALRRHGLSLTVPEGYGHCAGESGVIIPAALSGGTLTQRLEDACRQFGRDRVVLGLEQTAEDFLLPSPTGCGTPLTQEELTALRERIRPSVFFSQELCARYFTYTEQGRGHFVLFDDGDTLRRKADAARAAGISSFLLPWTLLDAFNLFQAQSSPRKNGPFP